MRGRFFWGALVLIGLSWVANAIYAFSKQLDEPIFLDHYIDMTYQDDLYVTFFYLTNKNDTSVINSLNAGDLRAYPDSIYFNDNWHIPNYQDFGRYVLRSVDVTFYNPYGDRLDYETTEMDVVFSDGRVITAPIGHIITRPMNADESPLSQKFSSNSNNNLYQDRFVAGESLTIEAVGHSFQDVLQDDFSIKINTPKYPLESRSADPTFQEPMNNEWNNIPGLDVQDVSFPIHLKEGDTLSIHSKFSTNHTKVLYMDTYIAGTTESGKAFYTTNRISARPYLEKKDVIEFIQARTKEGSR